ncbi:WXG100 family type VII secretion target [Mycobacterium simiae]|uniref:WXG100 family type VII secretion target n=1 Tax=Mycobacterium simiae TaxID=1784 RepID=A0A5B1BM19_MYCSI|nr:WXG100 family type VII secretion target [Mycobacterium simiae]KAA1249111.1 WXG100 family type VII secretion target [Mycobacterium simiae]
MADNTIQVTPQMLRSTAHDIQANMEHAIGIANGYLANQENVMNPATWSGAGVVASHATATEVANDLNKVLTGGTRLAEGLVQAAALMESHEADSQAAFQALFGGGHGS